MNKHIIILIMSAISFIAFSEDGTDSYHFSKLKKLIIEFQPYHDSPDSELNQILIIENSFYETLSQMLKFMDLTDIYRNMKDADDKSYVYARLKLYLDKDEPLISSRIKTIASAKKRELKQTNSILLADKIISINQTFLQDIQSFRK